MNYDGGKNGEGVYQRLINEIPPHDVRIEAFAGSLAISYRMKPALVNFGIDTDAITLAAVQSRATAAAVTLMEGDALVLVPWLVKIFRAAGAVVFVYADPPYLRETRSWQGHLYRCEFDTIEQHTALLDMLDALDCLVMLSGYWHPLYRRLASPKWRDFSYMAASHYTIKTWCWCNFPDPVALHDYSHLGKDRTERQRIKRKIANRVRLLKCLPPLERAAILDALQELKTCASARPAVQPGTSTGSRDSQPTTTVARRPDLADARDFRDRADASGCAIS
jgi:DNA adenine methylase